jgi:hypothetical protein
VPTTGASDVEVTLEEWEGVPACPSHFLMIAGHQRSEGERVVDTLSEYEVAPKTRLTGRCAKRRCTRLRGHSERVTGSDRPAAFAVLAA